MKPTDKGFEIKTGAKAEMVLEAGLRKGRYSSYVDSVEGDIITLAHPMLKTATLPVHRDMEFDLIADSENGRLSTKITVVRSNIKDKVPVLICRITGPIIKTQRRNFFRVNSHLEAMAFPLELESRAPMQGVWNKVTVQDVSLGGVRIEGDFGYPIGKGDRVFMKIPINKEVHCFTGTAVRVVDNGKCWDVSTEFESVPKRAEKDLVSLIQQLERLSRGTGGER